MGKSEVLKRGTVVGTAEKTAIGTAACCVGAVVLVEDGCVVTVVSAIHGTELRMASVGVNVGRLPVSAATEGAMLI